MKRTILLAISVLSFLAVHAAPLPLEAFTRAEQYDGIKISPDGSYLAAVSNIEGTKVLIILDRDKLVPTFAYRFGENKHVGEYYWANNERLVYKEYFKEPWSERTVSDHQIYAGNFDGSKRKIIFGYQQQGPFESQRANRDADAIRAGGYIIDSLVNDPKHILIKAQLYSDDVDDTNRIYKVNIYTGKRRLITRGPIGRMDFLVGSDGELKLGYGLDRNGDRRTFLFKEDEWQEISQNKILNNTTPIYYDAETNSITLIGYPKNNLRQLFKYDITNNELSTLFKHEYADLNHTMHDPVSKKVYGLKTIPGNVEVTYLEKDNPIAKSHRIMSKALKGYDVSITSATSDGNLMIVFASSDKNPGDYYLYNRETNRAEYLLSSMQWLDPEHMAKREPISFKARDGEKIYGYLTLPKGEAKDLPLVTYVHGGPYGEQDTWYFDNTAQMLANNGYAVLQVNYRGSSGYGEQYKSVAYQKRSSLIQQDIVDGTRWAMSQPEISNDACIMGWSFGGYSAVMAPIVAPGLFKCSVAAAGVYDAVMQEEDADYAESESLKKIVARDYGNDKELLKTESPITYIDKFDIPVLIVHGEKDERVPFNQAELLVQELEKRNKSYQTLFKSKEGHFVFNPENQLDYYQTTLKFLDKHIR